MPDALTLETLRSHETRAATLRASADKARSAIDRATERAALAAADVYKACGKPGKPASAKEALAVADAAIEAAEAELARLEAEADAALAEAEAAMSGAQS